MNEKENKTMDNKTTTGSRKRRKRNKSREVEVDVERTAINKADMFTGGSNRKSSGGNDPSWYNHYPDLTSNAAVLNFSDPIGGVLDYGMPTDVGTTITFDNTQSTIPGICGIAWMPTVGKANASLNSPINKAAFQSYMAQRYKLSSVASYDPSDTALYEVAMDSAFTVYGFMAKIYGTMRLTNLWNRYLPQALIKNMGVDFEDIWANLSQFRALMNTYAVYLSNYAVPSSMDYFKRHFWLSQSIFMDGPTVKSQIYHFNLYGYYTYVEVTDGPAYCKWNTFRNSQGNLLKFADFKTITSNILNALNGSQDINQMSADILKAYDGNIFRLTTIPDDFVIVPEYNEEVLTQIENMILVGEPTNVKIGSLGNATADITVDVTLPDVTSPRIVQNMLYTDPVMTAIKSTGYVNNQGNVSTALPYSAATCGYAAKNQIINLHKNDPTVDDVMVASRGIVSVESDGFARVKVTGAQPFSYNVIKPQNCGSELFLYAQLTNANTLLAARGEAIYTTYMFDARNVSVYDNPEPSYTSVASLWSCFDHAPRLVIMQLGPNEPSVSNANWDTTTSYEINQYHDFDNYELVSNENLETMHTAAMLSLFYNQTFTDVTPQTSKSNKR